MNGSRPHKATAHLGAQGWGGGIWEVGRGVLGGRTRAAPVHPHLQVKSQRFQMLVTRICELAPSGAGLWLPGSQDGL